MDRLEKSQFSQAENPDFEFTLSGVERQELLREIEKMKEKLREFLENRQEKPHMGLEILGVDTENLDKKELCFFKLYRALCESNRATVDDWKKILLVIADYREQIRARQQQECGRQTKYCDSKEMSMQDEFLAWVYNLALAQYGKLKGTQLQEEKRKKAA